MMRIFISKRQRLCLAKILLLLFFALQSNSKLFAQQSAVDYYKILQQTAVYDSLPQRFMLAVLPIVNCFSCEKAFEEQMKKEKESTFLIVHPTARKVVQNQIRKDDLKMNIKAYYIFDDAVYSQLKDPNKQKGYLKAVKK